MSIGIQEILFSYRRKPLFQIRNDVDNVLRADGKTDGAGRNALVFQFRFRQLGMGGRSRMDHQALHVSHVGQQGEYFQAVNKLPCCFLPAFDFKSEDRGAAIREVFLIQRMVRMSG